MKRTYKRLYNFPYCRAEKAGQISYLEELTKILYNVGDLIDSEKYYFFSDDCYLNNTIDEPNTSYGTFISDLKNTFANCCDSKICIIRRHAGIGKAKFI